MNSDLLYVIYMLEKRGVTLFELKIEGIFGKKKIQPKSVERCSFLYI